MKFNPDLSQGDFTLHPRHSVETAVYLSKLMAWIIFHEEIVVDYSASRIADTELMTLLRILETQEVTFDAAGRGCAPGLVDVMLIELFRILECKREDYRDERERFQSRVALESTKDYLALPNPWSSKGAWYGH